MLVCLCVVVWMQAKEGSGDSHSSEKWVGTICAAFYSCSRNAIFRSRVGQRMDGPGQMISKNFSKSKVLCFFVTI